MDSVSGLYLPSLGFLAARSRNPFTDDDDKTMAVWNRQLDMLISGLGLVPLLRGRRNQARVHPHGGWRWPGGEPRRRTPWARRALMLRETIFEPNVFTDIQNLSK